MTPSVVIYRENLLAYSETFILNQAEALTRFSPYYVGTRRVDGIATPAERTLILNGGGMRGRLSELWYKATGLAPQLHQQLRAIGPRLIHAHFGPDGAQAVPLARRLNVPLVVTFHGFDATMHDADLRASAVLRDRQLVTKRPQLIQAGALFIAVSEHIRRQLLAKGFPAHKVITHYNGIDTSVFVPAAEPAQEALVLFVGRYVEKKGVSFLLRAMHAVQQRLPAARLVLIGEGPLLEPLEQQAAQLGLSVLFTGRQTPEQVRDWMRAARVMCVPSITAQNGDTEGLPTVILEAMAMGLPTVTTDSAGNPEAVRHGTTGWVVPERDEAGLAHFILTLLEDPDLSQRFRAAALDDVRSRFDSRALVRGLESHYERVVSASSAHAPQPHFSGDAGSV
ncbi:glycosyltransferase [Deinococcus sp. Arct2-2]|uniref:glycosyltransferase n=1 Tax=Deinococcus sp. Arct2-2 TaxID=2568653 RepID=UPI0010A335FF|nr:glycosyltransferase [Deinococcus sp. Arct2-2]THF71492.1 glycosyltransferase [Deinococcus sp. Arct2-2]